MLQYRCDDQGGPQPPKPWKEGDPKPQPKPPAPGEPGYEEKPKQ
jgi:hypothetical protein